MNRLFVTALLIGLFLRIGLIVGSRHLGAEIEDEQDYARLAKNISIGNGFAWGPGQPTSIRPPLYPALVSAIWSVTGVDNFVAIRIVQSALALATACLVYLIARRAFNVKVAAWAAAIFWLYPCFIFFNLLVLTESLFTFFVVVLVLLSVKVVDHPRTFTALGCGIALGLAALTRSVLWPFPLVLCPILALLVSGSIRTKLSMPLFVALGYGVIVTPWAIRNTKLQGVVEIVDTMGGLNLRMGNYEYTPDDRMWAAVGLSGEKNWAYSLRQEFPDQPLTEGQKDKWAQRKAFEYMRAHPLVTIRRGLIKSADLFGIEREFIAGVQHGMYDPPRWFVVVAATFICLGFPALALTAGVGVWLVQPERRVHVLLLLPLLFIAFGHIMTFGHSRYHLPFVPILAVYAAAVLHAPPPRPWRIRGFTGLGAITTILCLIAVWFREFFIVDFERIKALFHQLS